MTNWPTPTGDEAPVAMLLRAILTMNVAMARQCIGLIDPNASDFNFPTAWKQIRPDCRGSRLLHEAVTYSCSNYNHGNRLEIVEMLLDAGANPNHLSTKGYAALHNAATVNHAPACRLLVARGAHINQQSVTGYTPLQTASLYKGTDATAALILSGADFHLSNQHGENAYDYAKRKQHTAAVSLMETLRLREEAESILIEIGAERARENAAHEASEVERLLYVRDELSGSDLSRQEHRNFWLTRADHFQVPSMPTAVTAVSQLQEKPFAIPCKGPFSPNSLPSPFSNPLNPFKMRLPGFS